MPNWCYNQITITGKPKAISKLMKQIEVTPSQVNELNPEPTSVSFQKIIPMPKELLEGDKWYQWRINNWGTKWEPNVDDYNYDDNDTLYLSFNTAWSPPTPIIETLSKQHPSLYICHKYYEEGMSFWGDNEIKNGKYEIAEEGEFTTCYAYNKFGLFHHMCYGCMETIEECNENDSFDKELCASCHEKEEEDNQELWEEGSNETTQKKVSV